MDHKEKVLAVATELFTTVGYDQATVVSIVSKADVPESTLRRYFIGGKEEIFHGAIERASESLHKEYLEELGRRKLDVVFSDTVEVILTCMGTVANLTRSSDQAKRHGVYLLFGDSGKPFSLGPCGRPDKKFVGDIIRAACSQNTLKAQGVSDLVSGMLTEYVCRMQSYPYHTVKEPPFQMIAPLLYQLFFGTGNLPANPIPERSARWEVKQAAGKIQEALNAIESALKSE